MKLWFLYQATKRSSVKFSTSCNNYEHNRWKTGRAPTNYPAWKNFACLPNPTVLCCIWDTNWGCCPICFLSVHWSPAQLSHCNAVFDKVQVWISVNKAALHSWIFNLLHAQQWRALHLVLHREQSWSWSCSQPHSSGCAEWNPAWLWDGRHPKSTKDSTGSISTGFGCFLDHSNSPLLSLAIKADYRRGQRSRASLTYWK